MKTKKKSITKMNNTKKNVHKLTSFEEKYEKNLKNSLIEARDLRDKNLKKMFDNKDSIKPTEDFYSYVNDIWYKSIKIKKSESYIVEIDDFRLVQYKIYNQLDDLIINYINTEKDKKSTCLANFYNSAIKLTNVSSCINYAKKELEIIDNYRKDKTNPWKLLAYMNKNEI
jgi:hypothetical protein